MTKQYPKSNYKEIRSQLKSEYKKLIAEHTEAKRKGYGSSTYKNVRMKHIAYSLFKGHSFEQIESKWKEPTSWVNDSVKRLALAMYESYKARIVETPVAQDANEL